MVMSHYRKIDMNSPKEQTTIQSEAECHVCFLMSLSSYDDVYQFFLNHNDLSDGLSIDHFSNPLIA